MSQERTRFPIQPKDVRRSAKSNSDVHVAGQGGRDAKAVQSDKPTVPPHQRDRAGTSAKPDQTDQDQPEQPAGD
jgi:hypothetical protein